jgi:hypothetical protein
VALHKSTSNKITVWRVMDGKRGHERQSLGLIQALKTLMPIAVQDVPALSFWQACYLWLSASFKSKAQSSHDLLAPDLIIGVGHATHMTLLALKKSTQAKAVVLMKPSLPCACFDLCLIPKHDAVQANNVLQTEGALNAMAFYNTQHKINDTGLILIGGPSKHYVWDASAIIAQIQQLLAIDAKRHWFLSTSRRTPEDFVTLLKQQLEALHLVAPQFAIVSHLDVDENWLPQQLAQSEVVWTSPDSVSMLYESLTAACRVGVFDLQPNPKSEIAASVQALLQQHKLVDFSTWEKSKEMFAADLNFNEALRCAQWIKSNWFPNH